MTQPTDILAPAIGACLNCRSLFLVTIETPACILCGQPPAYTLPFPAVPPGFVEPTPDEPTEPAIPSTSSDEPPPAVEVPPPAAGEELAEGLAPAGSKPILALFRGIHDFLGGIVEYPEQLRALFLEAHAEDEESRNAIGRLVAVRDLVDSLWERFQPEPTEPMEPPPDAPADEG